MVISKTLLKMSGVSPILYAKQLLTLLYITRRNPVNVSLRFRSAYCHYLQGRRASKAKQEHEAVGKWGFRELLVFYEPRPHIPPRTSIMAAQVRINFKDIRVRTTGFHRLQKPDISQ
jgi:hypothetical protein